MAPDHRWTCRCDECKRTRDWRLIENPDLAAQMEQLRAENERLQGDFVGPCRHGRDPFDRCEDCGSLSPNEAEIRVLRAEVERLNDEGGWRRLEADRDRCRWAVRRLLAVVEGRGLYSPQALADLCAEAHGLVDDTTTTEGT